MMETSDIDLICQKGYIAQYIGTVPYQVALNQQETLRQLRAEGRIPDAVLLLQHPHVYTVGRFRGKEDIIVPPENIPVLRTNRGGSITYHGPGQLVGYPVLDLRANGLGVREYIWKLEEVIIGLLRSFGIEGQRNGNRPGGVWAGDRKMCSIGINVSHYITTHGFALNVNNDLKYFDHIRPCGMEGASMTSMAELLGRPVPFDAIVHNWIRLFSEVFALKREMNLVLPVEEVVIV
ncbi:MAG: lipoyl(octanoyl) transferase LipB [Chloroflexota bacterium]|nr:lipoyl(octanoyl) transferase LipB [Chloroflexota bacterium]